ncbi:MAG: HAD family phosphatase [Chloroflexota bacterium]
MKIKAVVWDMDGLLIDSEPIWNAARKEIAGENGVNWNQQDHFNVMGVSTIEWTEYMIERIGLTLPPEEVKNLVIDHMAAMYAKEIPFRPYALEKIEWAASLYPSCIASGSPRQLIDIVSAHPMIAKSMQFTLAADEVGPGKPDPAIYIEAAKRLNIEPAACLCIEDSPNGVLSGSRAGMRVINIPDPEMPLTAEQAGHADVVLKDLSELTEALVNSL